MAGFIGSPAMNFVPAEFDGDRIKLPMAELEPPEPLRACLSGRPRPLIAGIRPEQLHDAATGGIDPRYGPTFRAIVDVTEWLGADLYVHFPAGTRQDPHGSAGRHCQRRRRLRAKNWNSGWTPAICICSIPRQGRT